MESHAFARKMEGACAPVGGFIWSMQIGNLGPFFCAAQNPPCQPQPVPLSWPGSRNVGGLLGRELEQQ